MIINEITKLQLQLIINNNLFKKKVIDENTFSKVNDKIFKRLKILQNS